MSSTSNVGDRRTYESNDQSNYSAAEIEQMKKENRFHEGKENSHKATDSKDERTIANKLAREEKREEEAEELSEEDAARKKDPTLPAINHGNEPSKGAKQDKEIQEEEAEILAKKGDFGPKAAN